VKPKEEQKQQVNMKKSLELVKDSDFKKVLTGILERVREGDIHKEAEEVKKKIIKTPKRPEQLIFAFIPHEMAKVSIFFPMSKKELMEERREIKKLEHESKWGKIIIKGVKLGIFEEDVFLALMKLAKDKAKYIKGQIVLETSIPEIAKMLYGHAGYTRQAYERIKRALDHFGLVTFKLILSKEQKEISIAAVIQRYDFDENREKLKIYFNPHFCAFFLESMLTGINFTIRRRLKKDGSKALMRFLATHSRPKRMHIFTVLNAINFNTNQPMYRLRSRLKEFIKELKGQGILGNRTKLYLDDTVYFDILPRKKVLPD